MGTAGAGVTCPVVGNRGALAGEGFGVACATRTRSAGTAGSVQNQNASADNPIRNARCFIPVLLPQSPRGLMRGLIRNSPVSFRRRAAALSLITLPAQLSADELTASRSSPLNRAPNDVSLTLWSPTSLWRKTKRVRLSQDPPPRSVSGRHTNVAPRPRHKIRRRTALTPTAKSQYRLR
jgi:hypothetical protein